MKSSTIHLQESTSETHHHHHHHETISILTPYLQVSPRQQRPAYSCFMQLALELSGTAGAPAPALAPRWADAGLLLEPLLRRFERGKAVQEAPAFPGPWKVPGMADMCLGYPWGWMGIFGSWGRGKISWIFLVFFLLKSGLEDGG
jgi:hypothetical protein